MKKYSREVVNYAYLGNNKALAVTNFGCRILIDTRNKQHLKIITHGVYEKAVEWAIRKHLAFNEVFVDIGANIGFFSLLGCHIVGPKGKVYALEPNPVIYEMMNDSLHINSFGKRSIRENIAAFNEDGEMELTWGTADHGGGRLVTHKKVWLSENKAKVKLQRLDDILVDNYRPISVIKIDTEGSEPYILEGATQTLKNNPQCVIISEWAPRFVESRGYNLDKYVNFLYKTFKSIQYIQKVGVAVEVDRDSLIKIRHGNIILKQIVSD